MSHPKSPLRGTAKQVRENLRDICKLTLKGWNWPDGFSLVRDIGNMTNDELVELSRSCEIAQRNIDSYVVDRFERAHVADYMET